MEVVEVVEGSPAARAGIRREDLVLELDGHPVDSGGDLQRLMTGELIGRTVPVRVLRAGEVVDLRITPVELDA